MCGEDGMKKAVYNMKEKHAERDRNIEKKHKEHSGRKLENQRTVFVSKKNRLLYRL